MAALQRAGSNLWVSRGPTLSAYGFPFPTRMAIVRLPASRLWIWSPVGLDPDLTREVASLGTPTFVVEPNKLHHLALSDWIRTWPSLRLYAPPGLLRKRRDLEFRAVLGDEIFPEWHGHIEQVLVRGSIAITEVVFFHRDSRACLVGDLIQKHLEPMSCWQRLVMKAGGVYGPEGSTPREWRFTFFNRTRARRSIERILAWDPERLVLAHGSCTASEGAEVLRSSLSWLLK